MTAEIIPFGGITRIDLDPDGVLAAAVGQCPNGVLAAAVGQCPNGVFVAGYDADGDLYFASSMSDGGSVIWLMELAKRQMLDWAMGVDE